MVTTLFRKSLEYWISLSSPLDKIQKKKKIQAFFSEGNLKGHVKMNRKSSFFPLA